jgi:Phosphotransferase enzyme family.
MDTEQVARLCAMLNLGTVQAEPVPVQGGLLHRMWRLSTARGSFAVKCLNPAIMQRPGIDQMYRLSERVAAACVAQGVPTIAALPSSATGDVIQMIDGARFLAYPWVEGVMLGSGAVEPAYAQRMGAVLAQIHSLKLQIPELTAREWSYFHDEDWDILTCQAIDPLLSWAYPVRAAMPRLVAMTRAYESVGPALSRHMVVSHTDLDQKNVLWQDAQTPLLIDWESAALINPTMELVSVALYWSGVTVGEPDEGVFAATIEGYVEAGGVITDTGSDAIHGFMGTWLGWLLFNMRRSLGESVGSDEERAVGIREAMATLTILRMMDLRADVWARWLDAWQ